MLFGTDLCSLMVVGVVFLLIGRKLTNDRNALKSWAKGLAGLSFLGCTVFGSIQAQSNDQLLAVVLTSLCVAGVVLGTSSILLWIAAVICEGILTRIVRPIRHGVDAFAEIGRRRERLRLAELNAPLELRAHEERMKSQEFARIQREKADQARLESVWETKDQQKRRERMRASCERLFLIEAPDIESRFPRDKFNEYVKRHLRDAYDAAIVEEHGEQLKEIIREHKKAVEQAAREIRERELKEKQEREERRVRKAEAERLAREFEREAGAPPETPEQQTERIRRTIEMLRQSGRSDQEIKEELTRQRRAEAAHGPFDPIGENELYRENSKANS